MIDGKAVLIVPLVHRDNADGVLIAVDSLEHPVSTRTTSR